MNTITVIDYGIVNLRNIVRGLERVGARVRVSMDPDAVRQADRLVLPGVGAFAAGMAELSSRGLDHAVSEAARAGTPLLGICLGMQMLLDHSEENGSHSGLGILAGGVKAIPGEGANRARRRKVPHIGWSALQYPPHRRHWQDSCLAGTQHGEFCYFVHSYMAVPENPAHILAQCSYEGLVVNAAIIQGNVTGLQFHPERSGPHGLKILEQFIKN
jgi:glutamine amidotransferase